MKSIKLSLLLFVCFLSLIGSALAQDNEKKQPEPWENPKLSPTQRWNALLDGLYFQRVNSKDCPVKIKEMHKNDPSLEYYQKMIYYQFFGFLGFWNANNRPPNDMNELCSSEFTSIEDNLKYQVTPILNPITNKPMKQVPFTNPSPGDITYLHYKSYNGVNNITLIVWNEKIDKRDIEFAKLIVANGGLIKFMHRNELFGHDYIRQIGRFMKSSIKNEYHYCQLPGQPNKYNVNNRTFLWEYWGSLLEGYGGINTPDIENRVNPLVKTLDQSLQDTKEFSKFTDPKLTPEQRWNFISDFIQSQQPESYQKVCKEESKENWLIHLDYALHFGTQKFYEQNKKLPNSIEHIFNSNYVIAGANVKIGMPENIYYLRPIQQTTLDVPAPGDISYFVDDPNNPKKVIALVWSQSPDNEEMYWLQLFDKTYGFMNFCTDPTTKEFRYFRRIFLTYFSNSIDLAFFINIDKNGKLIINE